MLVCPIMTAGALSDSVSNYQESIIECKENNCALFCPGEKVCSLKSISMELIKVNEKN